MELHKTPSRVDAADLARAYSLGPRALRRSWIVMATLGESAGFLVPALVAVVAFGWYPMFTLTAMVLAGSVEGAMVGAAQASVLHKEFLGFSRSGWIGVTAVGAAGAWFIGMLPTSFSGLWENWSPTVLVPLSLVLGGILLTVVGFGQWFVLRRHVARSRTWVPVSALAWLAGLAAFFAVTTPLWHDGQSTVATVAVGAGGGLLMAFVMAVITGWWLAHLVAVRTPTAGGFGMPQGLPQRDWQSLAEPTDRFHIFDPDSVGDLPDPVQRWVRHAIAPGAPLLTGIDAEWYGHLRLRGAWRLFFARYRATLTGGFVWAARTRILGLPVTGFDRYTRAEGEMCWRLLRRLRLVAERSEQVTRSAAGRHAAELFAFSPAVALDPAVRWEPVDRNRAVAHLVVDGALQAITVRVDPVGRLRQVEMDRWGVPPGCPFDRYRFGALLSEERRFGGYLVPTEVLGGWHIGTGRWDDGIFLRYRILRCSFH